MAFFSFKTIFSRFTRRLLKRNRLFLGYSSAAVFWDNYRITNDELKTHVNEMLTEFRTQNHLLNINDENPIKSSSDENKDNLANEWEKVFHKKDLIIWRRKLTEFKNSKEPIPSYLYEYRLFGRLYDVTPLDFYKVQIDLDYRSVWDHLVVSLKTIDFDQETKSELVHWIMKFPYPMYSREYIYRRRNCMEPVERLLIVYSHSIQDPDFKLPQQSYINKEPNKSNQMAKNGFGQPQPKAPFVRVTHYESQMIIIPHTDFDKNGFDYILKYYDDPKARIPNMAYKWMAASGLPDWLEKLHEAARKIPKNYEEDLKNIQLFYLNEPTPPPPQPPSEPPQEDKNEVNESSDNLSEKSDENETTVNETKTQTTSQNSKIDGLSEPFRLLSNIFRFDKSRKIILHDFEHDPLPLFFII